VNAAGVDFPCIYIHHSNIASVPFVTVRNVCVATMLPITFPSKFERPRRVLTLRADNLQSYDGFRIQVGLLSGKGRVLLQMYCVLRVVCSEDIDASKKHTVFILRIEATRSYFRPSQEISRVLWNRKVR
jgi:hypothetical protein